MKEIEQLISGLHPLERAVVKYLKENISLDELVKLTKLKEVEVMRAIQWLENKGVLKIKLEMKEVVELDKNGEYYLKGGLPERRLLKQLVSENELTLDKVKLPKGEINAAVGLLKKRAAVEFRKEKDSVKLVLTENGKRLAEQPSLEEQFLKELPLEMKSLKPEQKFAYDELRKRKDLIKTRLVKIRTVSLTEKGRILLENKDLVRADYVEKVTPGLLKNGAWKNKKFRAYDVKINVPKIFGGRKQHYRAFLDMVRRKFISLGFEEMTGPIVETDFWDMDALFMPQFHSARDIHDAYYLKEPKFGEVDERLIKKVKAAHEHGGNTSSKGWQYEFDVVRTKRLLLRTQGTACSARKLASHDLKVPGKYFGITRCFRYDVVDATHNCDFYQTEGIVLEENLTFGHLKGLLKMFAEEFAQAESVKVRPAYFPFTEPSAEIFAKHPEMGWIELGGAGIFRPELTNALGVKVPVMAWGLGIDRIAMFALGINDIRGLFSYDLKFLRTAKIIW